MGPPGSGKGTQAKKLEKSLDYRHISTGDLLRKAVENGSPVGKIAEGYMKEGMLVPDEVIMQLVESVLLESEKFTLDGFPRNINQAKLLEELLFKIRANLQHVIYLKVSDDEIVERLLARRVCPKCGRVYNLITSPPKKDNLCDSCGVPLVQREDDNEVTIRNRLKVYRKETAPLIEYYERSGILKEINASRSPYEIFSEVLSIIRGKSQ